jgi:hypothetical protein
MHREQGENMEYKKSKIKILIIAISIVGLAILSGLYGFTVVPIQQVKELKISEKFDPKAFVDGIWESKLIPTIKEKAVDLSLVLGKMKPDDSSFTSIDSLIPITNNYGLITVGEAHVYIVKGQGKVVIQVLSRSNFTLVRGSQAMIVRCEMLWALSILEISESKPSMAKLVWKSTNAVCVKLTFHQTKIACKAKRLVSMGHLRSAPLT